MRKFLACFLLIIYISSWIGAAPDLKPTREFYVNDYANVLSDETEERILKLAESLERSTSAQIVVLTIPRIENGDAFSYSLAVARAWGIGDAVKNNGVLIFLSIDDRQSYVQVGYGLEGRLTDAKVGRFQDQYLIPELRVGDYNLGIEQLFNIIASEVYQEYGHELPEDLAASLAEEELSLFEIILGMFLFVALIGAMLLSIWQFIYMMVTIFSIFTGHKTNFKGPFGESSGGSGSYDSGGGSSSSGGGGSFGGGGSGRSW